MAQRVSIYLPDPVLPVIGPYSDETGVSLSGRLTTIVLRYGDALRRARPQLKRAEWLLVLDALNGVGLVAHDRPELAVAGVALEVADHIRLNDAGKKWGLSPANARGLVERLRGLSHIELLSVVEAAEQFWLRAEQPTDQAFAESGIVPSDARPEAPKR